MSPSNIHSDTNMNRERNWQQNYRVENFRAPAKREIRHMHFNVKVESGIRFWKGIGVATKIFSEWIIHAFSVLVSRRSRSETSTKNWAIQVKSSRSSKIVKARSIFFRIDETVVDCCYSAGKPKNFVSASPRTVVIREHFLGSPSAFLSRLGFGRCEFGKFHEEQIVNKPFSPSKPNSHRTSTLSWVFTTKHMVGDGYISDIESAVKFSFFAKLHVHSSRPENEKVWFEPPKQFA